MISLLTCNGIDSLIHCWLMLIRYSVWPNLTQSNFVHSLHEDICYYTTYEQKLYKYVCSRTVGRPEFLARWYGSDVITELRMYEGQVYLLTSAGKLLTYSKQKLEVGGFSWPRNNVTTREVFHLFGGNNLLYCSKYLHTT